ncbi:MAG: hypothetical protein AAGC88_01005 [Bacteroidota bacterium]
MRKRLSLIVFILVVAVSAVKAQTADLDSLRRAIVELDLRTQAIQMNIDNGQKQFKTGIIVSTIGYSVTIAGGLMLGRDNDELGQALLIAGGATGLTGTFLMADAFAVLAGKKKRRLRQ